MKCRICANEIANKEFKAKEMMFGLRDEFVYFLCADCGCLQISEIPEDMSKYYHSGYCSFRVSRRFESRLLRMVIRLRDHYAFSNMGFIGKLLHARFPFPALRSLSMLNLKTQAKILDIGCGSGGVLHALRDLGFKNLLGVDAHIEKSLEYANGVRILKGTIFDIHDEYNIIMFHHSFEHIDSPHETLGAVSNLLSGDGVCVIRIPVVDSWAWENYRTYWYGIDAPRHFFLHSKKSVEILAKKTGFRVKDIVYDSTEFQFWASEQYKKDIPLYSENSFATNPSKSIFSRRQIRMFQLQAEKLNAKGRGDQAAFYLEKIQAKNELPKNFNNNS